MVQHTLVFILEFPFGEPGDGSSTRNVFALNGDGDIAAAVVAGEAVSGAERKITGGTRGFLDDFALLQVLTFDDIIWRKMVSGTDLVALAAEFIVFI